MIGRLMLLGVALVALPSTASSKAKDKTGDAGFVPLFNGKDFTNWVVPEGDNGHWKVAGGVIDYDALSESKAKDKSVWSEKEYGDFALHVEWRLKETPFVNPNVPVILPDGTHKLGPD